MKECGSLPGSFLCLDGGGAERRRNQGGGNNPAGKPQRMVSPEENHREMEGEEK